MCMISHIVWHVLTSIKVPLKMFWRFTCNIFLPRSVDSYFNKRPLNCIPPFSSPVCLRCYCLHVGLKAFSCVYRLNGASRFFYMWHFLNVLYIQVAAKVEDTSSYTKKTKWMETREANIPGILSKSTLITFLTSWPISTWYQHVMYLIILSG